MGAPSTGLPGYCDTGYCDKTLIVTVLSSNMFLFTEELSDIVTIGYCDTFRLSQHCHNKRKALYSVHCHTIRSLVTSSVPHLVDELYVR